MDFGRNRTEVPSCREALSYCHFYYHHNMLLPTNNVIISAIIISSYQLIISLCTRLSALHFNIFFSLFFLCVIFFFILFLFFIFIVRSFFRVQFFFFVIFDFIVRNRIYLWSNRVSLWSSLVMISLIIISQKVRPWSATLLVDDSINSNQFIYVGTVILYLFNCYVRFVIAFWFIVANVLVLWTCSGNVWSVFVPCRATFSVVSFLIFYCVYYFLFPVSKIFCSILNSYFQDFILSSVICDVHFERCQIKYIPIRFDLPTALIRVYLPTFFRKCLTWSTKPKTLALIWN